MLLYEVLLPITHTFHWELKPFFRLFRKFWGKEEVAILSDLDPKIPGTRFVPIRHTIAIDWSGQFSNNLKAYLENDSQANFVVILMADYWLTNSVNLNNLKTLVKYMLENPDVIRLQISWGMDSKASDIVAHYEKMEIRNRKEFFRGSLIPGLWSKKLLIEYLRPNLDIWGTEKRLSDDIEKSKVKSYLVMPEIIKYQHIVRTSARSVNLTEFPIDLKKDIVKFIPSKFQVYDVSK